MYVHVEWLFLHHTSTTSTTICSGLYWCVRYGTHKDNINNKTFTPNWWKDHYTSYEYTGNSCGSRRQANSTLVEFFFYIFYFVQIIRNQNRQQLEAAREHTMNTYQITSPTCCGPIIFASQLRNEIFETNATNVEYQIHIILKKHRPWKNETPSFESNDSEKKTHRQTQFAMDTHYYRQGPLYIDFILSERIYLIRNGNICSTKALDMFICCDWLRARVENLVFPCYGVFDSQFSCVGNNEMNIFTWAVFVIIKFCCVLSIW